MSQFEKYTIEQIENIRKTQYKHYLWNIPEEIVSLIWSYVPSSEKIWYSKKLYLENHKYLEYPIINTSTYRDSFIRDIIRKDFSFVFNTLKNENINRWIKKKKYIYKSEIFSCYADYLLYLCVYYDSSKCNKIMQEIKQEHSFLLYSYKHYKSSHNKWTI